MPWAFSTKPFLLDAGFRYSNLAQVLGDGMIWKDSLGRILRSEAGREAPTG